MKIIHFVFAIVMVISLMTIVNANERKQRSTHLFRDRLLDLLLEAKRRELLFNQYKEFRTSDKDQSDDEDHHGRTYVRRKVVGISDNPF